MKGKVGMTSSLFNCQDCDWTSGVDYENARKQAHNHAKKMGHRVTGNVTTAYHYDGKAMK